MEQLLEILRGKIRDICFKKCWKLQVSTIDTKGDYGVKTSFKISLSVILFELKK